VNDDLDDIMERYLDKHVLLDFKDVTHVDTSTLAGMIILLDKLQKKRRKLGIVNTAAHLEDYFAIGKIGSLMHVYGSEESAFSDMMKQ
jgi:anti-anti-sigma regulatory factor